MREIIKREVSKLILAVFIYANLSPAVVCGKAYYHVVVERSRIGEGYTARIDKKGEDGNYRRLIEERPLNAFRETSDVSDRSKVNIEELLQKIRFKERIEAYGGGGTLD
ncbi:MAG: hypothetical protein LBM19_00520, partial [Holosporales bacterium]|nr:hypothetical protein [Holosporales bacterium]